MGKSYSISNRLLWLDYARGIAFLMVWYSHQKYSNDNIMAFFTPVFLTMFFFVSGYLFKSDYSFSKLLEHRTRTLFLPWLIFSLLIIFSEHIIIINPEKHITLQKDLLDMFISIRGKNDRLWFVAALFVMNFPFYFLVKYSKNMKRLLLIALIGFLLSSAYYSSWLRLPELPWYINFTGSGCFYMALGFAYKHYEHKLKKFETKTVFFCALLTYVVFVALRKYVLHLYLISFNGSDYVIDALIITLLGIFIMIYLSKRIKQEKLILFVGTNSLLYFCLHYQLRSLMQVVADKAFVKLALTHSATIDIVLGVGLTLLGAVILIVPVILINKYLPFIIGKGFKLYK